MRRVGIFMFALLGVSLIACNKDASKLKAGEVLAKGRWYVSYFWDEDHDKTSDFAGYEFTFDKGLITATNGMNTITGTYSDSMDDGKQEFRINISSPIGTFNELNDDDWYVIEKTNSLIKLRDDDDSDNDAEILHFSKI